MLSKSCKYDIVNVKRSQSMCDNRRVVRKPTHIAPATAFDSNQLEGSYRRLCVSPILAGSRSPPPRMSSSARDIASANNNNNLSVARSRAIASATLPRPGGQPDAVVATLLRPGGQPEALAAAFPRCCLVTKLRETADAMPHRIKLPTCFDSLPESSVDGVGGGTTAVPHHPDGCVVLTGTSLRPAYANHINVCETSPATVAQPHDASLASGGEHFTHR